MAFFYVQHLSPDHPSMLVSILSQDIKIKIYEAGDMMKVEPDTLYVCTPNKEMVVANGKIRLKPRNDKQMPYLPINNFFTDLAKRYKEQVIGIILSGNATDGTLGLKNIKQQGGVTFAQDDTAEYSGMPTSAVASGAVDFILSPKEIALARYRMSKGKYVKPAIKAAKEEPELEENDPAFKAVLDILHQEAGIDFHRYKMNTIKRRLLHRMIQCNVKTLEDYLKLLTSKKDEVGMLYKDLLINVTSFFRDKEAFVSLKNTYLPHLLKNKNAGATLRIWVAGCSTGEEAYSIAMIINELQPHISENIAVKIFATDVSQDVLNIARRGIYSESDIKGITPSRIKKFFIKEGNKYHIAKELRLMCVFALHNLLTDPPFSQMDFISCRNVLIYFDAAAQKRALLSFHFALNDGGYLMLGKSETIGTSGLFTEVNNKNKIFSRRKTKEIRKIPELMPRFIGTTFDKEHQTSRNKSYPSEAMVKNKTENINSKSLNDAINSILISSYMPPCAIINKDMDIIQFRGSTAPYLTHRQGKASLNILKMTSPEFAFELRNAVNKVIKSKKPFSSKGLEMQVNGTMQTVSLDVHPMGVEWDEPLFMVIFKVEQSLDKAAEQTNEKSSAIKAKDNKIKRLSEELNAFRGEMNNIIESHETAYEALQAANEEIVSANEEFQTLNEELETTREEVEASNEELNSTNQELRLRNDQLTEANNYSEAIFMTMHEPMLILNNNLIVKSANQAFYRIFDVKKGSTEGFSVFELGNKQWNIPELHELLEKIITHNTSFNNYKVEHNFPLIGERTMLLNASRIFQKSNDEQLILLAIDDVTLLTQIQNTEKKALRKSIDETQIENERLEDAVRKRTAQLENAQRILLEKNAELEKANEDLTSFTYVSSHDLQEPLRKIQIFSNMLLMDKKLNLSDSGKNYFNRIQNTANQMQKLLNDLLAYSRSKNPERNFEKYSLNLVVDKVISDLSEEIKQKKAIIEYGKLCSADIIPFQFQILFNNLITNALRFSDPQRPPRIIIRSRKIDGDKLKNEGLQPGKKYCHISVTDNGTGFDNQYKDKIFEVFQRLNSREENDGTGIGLAICKRIIENHNGVINATGKLGKGATFNIYVPM